MEGISFVTQLAIILIAAGVFTLISRALKQPLILGYIVAGFIVGPHLGLFPQMGSAEDVEQWSEIGIIFLLFALGLEFSLKKLIKVGTSALVTAGTKCIGMFIVGLVAGHLMGWTQMESIFLGGLLSMSSTTIIIKAYDEMGLKKKPYADLIFGSLVVEDLIAVLLMVLLSTLAVSNSFAGGEMVWSLAKLAFNIVLWFLLGIYLIPSLLKRAKRFLNDEILLILSIGLCFGMVTLSTASGFSSALGAFVMGSILAETVEGEKIEKLMGTIKDLFGAIFFVSVGMMVDPAVIAHHWLPIIIITVVAMAGILISSTTGVLLAGKGLDTAVHAGFSLAQLGEFAFIIASLGCSMGVMRDFIYPVIIAVSVITTFTTPYMIKLGDPVSLWLHRTLPAGLVAALSPKIQAGSISERNAWKDLLRTSTVRLVLYGVILVALGVVSGKYLDRLIISLWPAIGSGAVDIISLCITLAAISPFVVSMVLPDQTMTELSKSLIQEKVANRWRILLLELFRLAVGMVFIGEVAGSRLESRLVSWTVTLALGLVLFFLGRHHRNSFFYMEDRFKNNLKSQDDSASVERVSALLNESLEGYDAHIEKFVVPQDFDFIGMTLREMPFRSAGGVNVVKIQRGSTEIIIPRGDEVIYPGDELYMVGTSSQLEAFDTLMKDHCSVSSDPASSHEFTVERKVVDGDSFLLGKSLRELKMRDYHCMVVSVLHGSSFHTNPKPDFRFEEGDIVWIAGEIIDN